MLTGIDHLVILVPDLAIGIRDYQGLGFTVIPGGEHPGGTHNALIAFADGAYIELIAFQDPNATNHRWHPFLSTGGGLVDFALGSTNLAEDVARLTADDLPYALMDGARARPDGVQIQWRSASVAPAGQLPFIIEDVTPRGLRVPSGNDAHHANNVSGVLSITIAVRDLASAKGRFTALLDAIPLVERDNADLHAYSATFVVGQHTIELAQPIDGQSPLEAHLTARGYAPLTEQQQNTTNGASMARHLALGSSPYSACLSADPGPAEAQWLDSAAANGARLQIVATKTQG